MTRDLALVMPMAGRGTRFHGAGIEVPKPLVELWGRPLFWWSAESVLRSVRVRELIFVVLAEHVERVAIDTKIREVYPRARIICIPEVTSGAAETAAVGVAALKTNGAFALNDCDHAFRADGLGSIVEQLHGEVQGALLGFRAHAPAYSYVHFDEKGRVVGTVEKQVVSEFAIAGCYLFADAQTFLGRFAEYRRACTYDELFVSGVYNTILRAGGEVLFHELAAHVSFGTPEELQMVERRDLSFLGTDTA
jgi:dTDP-glucose pyrophosphorylase